MQQIQEVKTTARQQEIIELIMKGLTHQQIADKLGYNRITIERDLKEITSDANMLSWFKAEWIKRYGLRIKDDPKDVECFRALTALIRRSETTVNLEQNYTEIKLTLVDPFSKAKVVSDSSSTE